MHPLLAFAGTYGPNIASWLLAHSGELGDAGARIARPVMAAFADPSASVDRIGSTLVSIQNGQTEVIGLLHQHTTQLDGITTAVDGVGRSVENVAQSIGVLTSLSMVGLGLSVLSQVHIAWQFAALTNRIKCIDNRVQAIQEMLEQKEHAHLDAGLIKLEKAETRSDPKWSHDFTAGALSDLTDSRANYARSLSNQLAKPTAGEPAHLWMLARHLTTALLGEALCHLRLGQPDLAVAVLRSGLCVLTRHATAVFDRTVGTNPTRFLIPAMAEYVTLERMAELYRQARHARGREDARPNTAADVFESLRSGLARTANPVLFKSRKVQRLRVEFAEASAAVEEVNRVHGLALVIDRCAQAGRDYTEVTAQVWSSVEARHPTEGGCFAVFPPL
jgi:hypothetical protein